MRYLFIATIAFLGLLTSCKEEQKEVTPDMIFFEKSASDSVDVSGAPAIEFDNKEYDFGRITEGEVVKHTFKFTNEGKSPLVLSAVNPSCGCTVARDWPKEPIPPGASGEIPIEFNSNKRPGKTNKTVTVITNSVPSTTILYIKGEVMGPDQKQNLNEQEE